MKLSDILSNPGRPVAYFPDLRLLTGSIAANLVLCQLIYWYGKQHDADGWIFKRAGPRQEGDHPGGEPGEQSLAHEVGLTYREAFTARRLLRERGFLRERYARSEHRLYFQLDLEAIERAWADLNREQLPAGRVAPARGEAGTPAGRNWQLPTGTVAAAKREAGSSPKGGSLNSNYIDYSETTTEITAESTAESAAAATSQGSLQESLPEFGDEHLPSTPLEAMAHPDIKLFIEVCGRVPGHTQYQTVIETMRHFRRLKGDATVEYLRPYWLAWCERRRRSDGQPYDPGSLTWLTEWALNGAIPPQNGVADARNHQGPAKKTLSAADLAVAAIINERERERRLLRGSGLPPLPRDRLLSYPPASGPPVVREGASVRLSQVEAQADTSREVRADRDGTEP